MRMTREQWAEIVSHAREEAPNECCGYMRLRDGSVEDVFRAVNERNSPYGYELGFEALRAANELEDEGWGVGIYHSHPRSAPEPSQTDINLAAYPGWLQLIVSLENEPVIRAWRIDNGNVSEEELDVAD